jgi:hypothetical protein
MLHSHHRLAILVLMATMSANPQGVTSSLNPSSSLDGEAAAMGLRRPNPSDPVERQILDLSKALDRIAGYSTPVWVCGDCQFSSDPKFGIIAGIEQVEEIRQHSKVTHFEQVLFWLLAHEFAHQVQFRVYGITLGGLPPAERQVYEAQADILAGKFLVERMPVDVTAEENVAMTEALHVAYDLGTEQYSPADHPSHDARLTAVRLGMAAGMQAKLRLGPDAGAQGSAAVLAQKIDLRYGEDVLPWSLRTARRATNQRLPEILNLVLAKEDFVFDRNPGHPVAAYWLTYENRGSESLSIDLEVLCAAAPREDKDDNLRWQWISTRNYHFDLPAASTYTVSGALKWYGDSKLLPRIIASPRPQALIHVERLESGATVPITPPNAKAALLAAQPVAKRQVSRDIERIALLDLTNAVSDRFLSLRAGPGLKLDDVVDYPSRVNFPGAPSTSVSIPEKGNDSDPWVSAILLRTANEAEASAAYKQAIASIHQALPPPGPWREHVNSKPGEYDETTYFESSAARFSIGRYRQAILGRYSVSVAVRPPH